MEKVIFFVVCTLLLTVFEWMLSWSIAFSLPSGRKGLGTDVLAAGFMLMAGVVIEMAGVHIAWECKILDSVLQANQTGCINFGEKMSSVGEMAQTTLGMNVVVAPVVLYFIINYLGPRLISYLTDRAARQ